MGTARAKLPAVAATGRRSSRPRTEYTPQHAPAASIRIDPHTGGALAPFAVRCHNPAIASMHPSQSIARGRSPRQRPQPIIVICTLANSSSAPAPAVMCSYAKVNASV